MAHGHPRIPSTVRRRGPLRPAAGRRIPATGPPAAKGLGANQPRRGVFVLPGCDQALPAAVLKRPTELRQRRRPLRTLAPTTSQAAASGLQPRSRHGLHPAPHRTVPGTPFAARGRPSLHARTYLVQPGERSGGCQVRPDRRPAHPAPVIVQSSPVARRNRALEENLSSGIPRTPERTPQQLGRKARGQGKVSGWRRAPVPRALPPACRWG